MHETSEVIAIAGTGRVARSLGRFLCDAGEPVSLIIGRDAIRAREAAAFIGHGIKPVLYRDLPSSLSHVLIAVSDSAVTLAAAAVAAQASPRVALHTCGVAGPDALEPLRPRGTACGTLHPLQTLTGEERSVGALRGVTFGVCGDSEALNWAQHIVTLARGAMLRVNPERMPLYHAAAVMASNSVLALVDASQRLLQLAGIESDRALSAIAPLLRTSIENGLRLGPVDALTGPVARGDLDTIEAHRKAMDAASGPVRDLYIAAARQAVDMARRKGLAAKKAVELEESLAS